MRAKVIDQILDNETRLCEDQGLCQRVCFHGDYGRFSQRVDLLELRGREHVLSLVGFELVVEFELFEEPEDTLGAGLREPGRGVLRFDGTAEAAEEEVCGFDEGV